MNKYTLLAIALVLITLGYYFLGSKNIEKIENATNIPLVGADVDKNGCKSSAGYTFSKVKNECIRIFESGISLKAVAEGLDKSLAAFVLFKSENEDTKAEIYLPNGKESILLDKAEDNGAGTWVDAEYKLTQWKGMYTLSDKNEKTLYQGMIAETLNIK